MHRTLPASAWRLGYRPALRHGRLILLGVWIVISIPLIAGTLQHNWIDQPWYDWNNYTLAAHRVLSGESLYDPTWMSGTPWLYSPILAWMLIPFVFIGYSACVGLHIGSLALLRDRWLIAVIAVSWPWWTDLAAGNVFGLVFVLGVLALRGSRWAEHGYLVACLLMPRPIQLPLLVWLLWKRPHLRVPFVGWFALNAALLLAVGHWQEWLPFLTTATAPMYGAANFGPTRAFGTAWLLIGVPLAAFLTWRGWIGLAAVAITPYLIPSYFLAVFWDWDAVRSAMLRGPMRMRDTAGPARPC